MLIQHRTIQRLGMLLLSAVVLTGAEVDRVVQFRTELQGDLRTPRAASRKAGGKAAAAREHSAVAALQSGTPLSFTLPAVNSAALFLDNTFRIQVPAGATRLEIQVRTATQNADVDVFVRHGSPVEVRSGDLVFDDSGESLTGDETVVITPPALRAGEYHIALALFTTGVEVRGTITATVTAPAGTTPPPTTTPPSTELVGAPIQLDTAVALMLPATEGPTLFRRDFSYRFQVPAGVRRFRVQLTPADPGHRMAVYVRAGSDVELRDGVIISDASGPAPNVLEVTRPDAAIQRTDTYYVAYALFSSNTPVKAKLLVSLDGVYHLNELRTETQIPLVIEPVSSPTLFSPLGKFEVPAGATRLEVRFVPETAGVDVDIFVGRNRIASAETGDIVADYIAHGVAGEETLSVSPGSTPALAPGWYSLSLATWTTGARITGSLIISVR